MFKIFASIVIIILLAPNIHAAPGSISASGTFTNGQSITISGTGFGTKTQAAPELWDNFESATIGGSLSGRSPVVGTVNWGVIGDPTVSTSNQRTNSSRSFYALYSGASDYNNSLSYVRTETTTGAKKYFSFWWRGGRVGAAWSRNMKPWTHFGSGSDQPAYYIGDGTGDGDPGFRSNVIDNSASLTRSGSAYGCGNMSNIEHEWTRWEGYLVLSDNGVQNGQMEVWQSQPTNITRSNCIHHATAVTRTSSNGFRQWTFGEFMDTSGGVESTVYMDDIYIDDTLARVELCDASTWSAVTHCEVQPATAWSSTSATATFNQGAFASEETAYLYVIDSDGAANSSGYAVEIGSSGAITGGSAINTGANARLGSGSTRIYPVQ
jgi:hypothetical protein